MKLWKTFLRLLMQGMSVLLPLVLTVYLLVWMVGGIDQLVHEVWNWLLPEAPWLPGMGILLGLFVVLAVGILVQVYFVRSLVGWLNGVVNRIPLVRAIYGSIKDFFDYFSSDKEAGMRKTVRVTLPHLEMELLGFVTLESGELLEREDSDKRVGVYLPMSYQIGGYFIMVPAERVEVLDMPFDDAMKLIMTAGVSHRGE